MAQIETPDLEEISRIIIDKIRAISDVFIH